MIAAGFVLGCLLGFIAFPAICFLYGWLANADYEAKRRDVRRGPYDA